MWILKQLFSRKLIPLMMTSSNEAVLIRKFFDGRLSNLYYHLGIVRKILALWKACSQDPLRISWQRNALWDVEVAEKNPIYTGFPQCPAMKAPYLSSNSIYSNGKSKWRKLYKQGDLLYLTLFWLAVREMTEEYVGKRGSTGLVHVGSISQFLVKYLHLFGCI